MICINSSNTDPYFNLAAEEYLLKQTSKDVLMVWQSEPCVIIGRHQCVEAEVNVALAEELRIKIARRSSGGGAVYDDNGNINLTFIETTKVPAFTKYSMIMIRFLEKLGVHAQIDNRGGVTVNGLKISGCAQAIRGDRIMFHASLLFSTDLPILNTILKGDYSKIPQNKYIKSVRSEVTNINMWIKQSMQINEFKQSIIKNILDRDMSNDLYTIRGIDEQKIMQLRDTKYATHEWNRQLSPAKESYSVNFKT